MLVRHLLWLSGHGCVLNDCSRSVTKAVLGPAFTELKFQKQKRHLSRQPRVIRAGLGEAWAAETGTVMTEARPQWPGCDRGRTGQSN